MANRDSITEKYFFRGREGSFWFQNLNRLGSCKVLRKMLRRDPLLLKYMGDGDVTVLDMAVRHGYAELVKDVLNMFNARGQCKQEGINFTLEDLLSKRNAEGLTVIGMAVMNGSFKVVRLLKRAIESCAEEGVLDKYVHDVKICSSLNYLTWKSMRSIHSPDQNPLSMGDDGNGQISNGARSPSSLFSTGDDAPSPMLAIDDGCSLPNPPSLRDDFPLQSETGEMERGEMAVHEIIQRVILNPIKYMEDIPKHESYQKYRKNKKYGVLELPSFKDFREKNSGFTEEHVRNCIERWVDECVKHPEFEFVDAKEVFIHFLCSVDSSWWDTQNVGNYSHVRFYFIAAVVRECKLQKVLTALFKMHDPQGRTPLHVAIEHWNLDIVDMLWRLMKIQGFREGVSDEEACACWNARDAAGRTPLHAMVISRYDTVEYLLRVEWVDVDARVCPQHYKEWVALLHWKAPCVTLSPEYKEQEHCTAIHLAVLHNHMHVLEQLIKFSSQSKTNLLNDRLRRGLFVQSQDHESLLHEGEYLSAIHLAASMGHVNILRLLLKENRVQDGGKWDIELVDYEDETSSTMPALHYAAFFGQAEATRAILRSGCYDQFALSHKKSTALHYAVTLNNTSAGERIQDQPLTLQDFMPYDSLANTIIQNSPPSSLSSHKTPRNYTGNERSCINLLLQAGIDVWTTNEDGEAPFPGSMANSEASQWWYEKVVSENLSVKKSLSDAANATSVIAALVATASFIGPLQPPRGYDSADGYIRIDHMLIQIYLIGNCLSFFFSVASIITAVIPCLPMPKESMDDEVKRSQRSIRFASVLLLISIVCILASFSAASIAVVPFGWSERNAVGICILLGGLVCLGVLTFYVLRLCRLVFHQKRFMRRMYDKYIRV